MRVYRHPQFDKHFKIRVKNNQKLSDVFNTRLELCATNPQNPLLKDHALIGEKKDLRAFSITGDIRVVFKKISDDEIVLVDIGSHNQVY